MGTIDSETSSAEPTTWLGGVSMSVCSAAVIGCWIAFICRENPDAMWPMLPPEVGF